MSREAAEKYGEALLRQMNEGPVLTDEEREALKSNYPCSAIDARNYMFYKMPEKMKCPDCKGSGETILFNLREKCETCNGTGEVTK